MLILLSHYRITHSVRIITLSHSRIPTRQPGPSTNKEGYRPSHVYQARRYTPQQKDSAFSLSFPHTS